MELYNGTSVNSTLDSLTARPTLRFEPITVRAAVRVIQLQRAGVVSNFEADFYISELAAMDRHTGAKGASALARLAQRQASPQRIARTHPNASFTVRPYEAKLAMAA